MKDSNSDLLLLHECIQKNQCDQFVKKYYNVIYYTVQKTNAFFSNEDIEDLTQEVFLQLFKNDFKKLKQYDALKGLSLSGWIKLIATRTVYNSLRTPKVKGNMSIDDIEETLWADKESAKAKPAIFF